MDGQDPSDVGDGYDDEGYADGGEEGGSPSARRDDMDDVDAHDLSLEDITGDDDGLLG